ASGSAGRSNKRGTRQHTRSQANPGVLHQQCRGRSFNRGPARHATDRVKVLRTAFDAMVKDPEFLAEIERAQQEFQPASGEELQKLIQDTASVPAEIVGRTGALLRSK